MQEKILLRNGPTYLLSSRIKILANTRNKVFNGSMNANETIKIIDAAGGNEFFARLLGINKQPGYQQRVNNWKRRGMPPAVVLEHYAIIKKLKYSCGK